MDLFSTIVLGAVQGLTEFLPISSSGHLVLVGKILPSLKEPGILFEVFLHAGTMLAILIYFRKKILRLTKNYLTLIIIGSIPAFLVGFLFQSFVEGLFESTAVVGFALLLTAGLNYLTDQTQGDKKQISFSDSLFIGIFQAIAIVPGISRSGSTIFAGVKRKIDKKSAAEFSFLLSIPAVVGANALQFLKNGLNGSIDFVLYFVGFISSFLVGYLAIFLVIKLLTKAKFRYFAIYCLIVGLIALLA